MISRLDVQKGFDLLVSTIDDIMKTGVGLVILGSGNEWLTNALLETQRRFPGRMAFKQGFDAKLAHRMIAGADIFLMPSLYEPCGLTQMYALKYGTVPVVRGTGGLEDTVTSYDPSTGEGNGFKFDAYEKDDFLHSVQEALATFSNRGAWPLLRGNGMNMDFSWDRSAGEYISIYNSVQR